MSLLAGAFILAEALFEGEGLTTEKNKSLHRERKGLAQVLSAYVSLCTLWLLLEMIFAETGINCTRVRRK